MEERKIEALWEYADLRQFRCSGPVVWNPSLLRFSWDWSLSMRPRAEGHCDSFLISEKELPC